MLKTMASRATFWGLWDWLDGSCLFAWCYGFEVYESEVLRCFAFAFAFAGNGSRGWYKLDDSFLYIVYSQRIRVFTSKSAFRQTTFPPSSL